MTPGRRRASTGLVFVLPLLVVMLVCFNVPIVLMLAWSLKSPTPTLRHYQEFFGTPVYLKVFWNTVRIALITTLVCVPLGYPLAYWIRSRSGARQLVALALVVLPFWISILVRTYAWIVLLGNAGLVNRSLLRLGLIENPVSILYNELGVIIGTVNVLLPFFVLPLLASMVRIDERLLQAAASLGASSRTVFWKVFFPLTVPAVSAGAILVFILTLGFYVTPAILGGGRVTMIANMLNLLINHLPNWELASTISTVLLVVVLSLYSMSRWLRNRAV
jgi:putative spermidine/putrescine transport system permease protein